MEPSEIEGLLKAKEAELEQVKAAHDAMWAKGSEELRVLKQRHQQLQAKMETEGGRNQLKLTHLEGMIDAYKELLPKPEATETPPA